MVVEVKVLEVTAEVVKEAVRQVSGFGHCDHLVRLQCIIGCCQY